MNRNEIINIGSTSESLSQATRMRNYEFAPSLQPPAGAWLTAGALRVLFGKWNRELKQIGDKHQEFSSSYMSFVEAIAEIDKELAQELGRAHESLTR